MIINFIIIQRGPATEENGIQIISCVWYINAMLSDNHRVEQRYNCVEGARVSWC